ncbi:MAG: T9SS type A sorting domain-containing protein [Flavobacteriales bacterium]|nr:T9SS type A sorting domain-containing protein [Flavobacteriales bacterium]
MRQVTLLFLVAITLPLYAQFSPHQFVFQSDVRYPTAVATGDLDGDGDLDVAAYSPSSSSSTSEYVWWPNGGDGTFGDKAVMHTGYVGNNLKLYDLDTDGDADMIIGNTWYRNNGTGTMTIVGSYLPPNTGGAQLFEDLDGDGDIDDVGRTATNVVLLLNDGTGQFVIGTAIGPAGTNTTLAASRADLDGDNDLDLVIGGNNTQVGWYASNGGLSYGAQQSIALFTAPAIPICGDVDGDGDADVLAVGAAPGMRWFENDGIGGFAINDTISTDTSIPQLVADLDGDGDLDYTVETGTSCNVIIARNNGGISWANTAVENFGAYSLQGTKYGTGDLDGDGDPDLVFCHGQGIVGWFAVQADHTWSLRESVSRTISYCQDVVAVDVDGDDDNDLVAASYHADMVTLYRNSGAGSFEQQEILLENFDQVNDVEAFDVDLDGDMDLVASSSGSAKLFLNPGDGSSWSNTSIDGAGGALSKADLNNDGATDLIIGSKWYANNGDGQFTEMATLAIGNLNKVGDVNGDGITDIVFIQNLGGITAQLNDGTGNFTTASSSSASYLSAMDLADLDDDGDLDIATVRTATPMLWYRNDGSGLFVEDTLITDVPNGGRAITCSDLDEDGDVDILWARSQGYTHSTYFLMNEGGGEFTTNALIDPTAEVTARMVLADVNGDAVEDLINARFHSLSWMENLFYDAYRLRGSVFYDFDQDAGLDNGELKVPYQLVRSDAEQTLVWTNSAGNYDLPVLEGTWDIWTNVPDIFAVSNDPDTLTATLTAAQPIASTLDFGLIPAVQYESNFLSFTTTDFLRCNTQIGAWLHLRNTGTTIPENILIDLEKHPDLDIVSTTVDPDSIVGDHYFWSLDSLGWFQEFAVYVSVQVGPVGSSSVLTVTVTSPDLEEPATSTIGGTVLCAFDPNDKLVTPRGFGPSGAVDIDTDWLEYTIRFQNTGTDTAFSVVLIDELDADLVPESMQVLAASHGLTRIQVEQGDRAMFRFDNIQLPDSGVDQLGSNGFVKYRVRPRSDAPHLTAITNQAAIYFDFNVPVITNTVLNTLVDCDMHTATIENVDGSTLGANQGLNYQWFLNDDPIFNATAQVHEALVSGSYSVQVTSEYGCMATSEPVQIISTGLSSPIPLNIGLSPNPFTESTVLRSDRPLTSSDRIEWVDLAGQVVRVAYGNGSQQVVLSRGGLMSGVYLLRLITTQGQRTVYRAVVR